MKLKYLGREVTIARNYFSVVFPNGTVFQGFVIPRKAFELSDIPRIIKLLILPLSYHEKEFLNK